MYLNFYLSYRFNAKTGQFEPECFTNLAQNVLMDIDSDETVADKLASILLQLSTMAKETVSGTELTNHTGDTALHVTTAKQTAWDAKESAIKNATAKTTLVDADTIPLSDSAASSATKKITWANIKSVLKTYFDSIYATVSNLALKAPIDSPAFTSNVSIAGNLTLKGSGNYGNKINFGDGDYVHLYEASDDTLNIKATTIKLYSGSTLAASITADGLIANSPAVGTSAMRNIYAGTSDLTAGSSSLTTGAIYLAYE